jgi:hypothetical protein
MLFCNKTYLRYCQGSKALDGFDAPLRVLNTVAILRKRQLHVKKAYWLLVAIMEWYRKSVPCNYDHFMIFCAPHLSPNHSRFVHQISLLWLLQRHLVVKRGETGREIAAELLISFSVVTRGIFTIP